MGVSGEGKNFFVEESFSLPPVLYMACRRQKASRWKILGGVMFNFSCSGLMDSELFQKITASAALEANVEARIVGKFTQSPDHPVLLSVPETFYLKGLCTAP